MPNTFQEALSHPGWRNAMIEEMDALNGNGTWNWVLRVCTNRSRPKFGPKPDRTEGFRSGLWSLKLLTPSFQSGPGKTRNIPVRTGDPVFFATYEDNPFH